MGSFQLIPMCLLREQCLKRKHSITSSCNAQVRHLNKSISRAPSAQEVLEIVDSSLTHFDERHVSTSLYRLAVQRRTLTPSLASSCALKALAERHLEEMSRQRVEAQALCNYMFVDYVPNFTVGALV